ncbi:uncharacterized, partial [Tachysurus ichikawai]
LRNPKQNLKGVIKGKPHITSPTGGSAASQTLNHQVDMKSEGRTDSDSVKLEKLELQAWR